MNKPNYLSIFIFAVVLVIIFFKMYPPLEDYPTYITELPLFGTFIFKFFKFIIMIGALIIFARINYSWGVESAVAKSTFLIKYVLNYEKDLPWEINIQYVCTSKTERNYTPAGRDRLPQTMYTYEPLNTEGDPITFLVDSGVQIKRLFTKEYNKEEFNYITVD